MQFVACSQKYISTALAIMSSVVLMSCASADVAASGEGNAHAEEFSSLRAIVELTLVETPTYSAYARVELLDAAGAPAVGVLLDGAFIDGSVFSQSAVSSADGVVEFRFDKARRDAWIGFAIRGASREGIGLQVSPAQRSDICSADAFFAFANTVKSRYKVSVPVTMIHAASASSAVHPSVQMSALTAPAGIAQSEEGEELPWVIAISADAFYARYPGWSAGHIINVAADQAGSRWAFDRQFSFADEVLEAGNASGFATAVAKGGACHDALIAVEDGEIRIESDGRDGEWGTGLAAGWSSARNASAAHFCLPAEVAALAGSEATAVCLDGIGTSPHEEAIIQAGIGTSPHEWNVQGDVIDSKERAHMAGIGISPSAPAPYGGNRGLNKDKSGKAERHGIGTSPAHRTIRGYDDRGGILAGIGTSPLQTDISETDKDVDDQPTLDGIGTSPSHQQ